MNADDLKAVLGHTDDSPEIVSLLAELGVKKKPRISADEDDVMIELPGHGLVLVFERVKLPRTSKIQLAGVQMYSDVEQGYANFEGQLPRGLSLADGRAVVAKKLGKPTKSRNALKLDIWVYPDHRLAVQFAKGEDRINVVHLMTPEEDD